MTMYFFYQMTPKSEWIPALAAQRAEVIKEKDPALCTVLDVDTIFEGNPGPDEVAAAKYAGPLYFDLDSENLPTAIEQVKKLLTLIKSKGVDLNMLRCYLTGGRGFHILMDPAIFMTKVPPTGTALLPAIYKEMVWSMAYVDDIDMRVYSARSGRQLRCVNHKRENGNYKVNATAAEILALDVDSYLQLCASPRNEVPVEPPKFNHEFGLAFSMATDKVTKSIAKRKAKSKTQVNLKDKFSGEWPETLKLLLQGEFVAEGVGFNQIAMQLAISAVALGRVGTAKSDEEHKAQEETFLADCAKLIENHQGDSDRYGTPEKRRRCLREMLRYVENNPLYEFSVGGVLSLLDPVVRANADIALGGYVPDAPMDAAAMVAATSTAPDSSEPQDAATGGAAATPARTPEVVEVFEEDQGAVRVSKAGIFVRSDDGFKSISKVGLVNPTVLRELKGDYLGFEVDVYIDGHHEGKKHAPMSVFASRGQFHGWASTWGGEMLGTDLQVGALINIMRKKAVRTGSVVYAVTREGVDIIVPPGCTDKSQFDVVWASNTEVISTGDTKYRFLSHWGTDGYSGTDLMQAPELTADDGEFVENLLKINTDENLAKMLGWFSASFLTQLIRKELNQFPLLQVFGQAEAGKSATVELMNGMHYYLKKPRQMASSGQTFFPIMTAVGTSASVPVVFEEMKPRQMEKKYRDQIQNLFRSNYRGDVNARGSVNSDKGRSELRVTDFNNSAPLVFVGEAIEDQSAILARCVVVSLSQTDRSGRGPYFEYCLRNATTMGKIGKAMVQSALSVNFMELGDRIRAYQEELRGTVTESVRDKNMRPIFNLSVVLAGLEFFRENMRRVFGDRFDERIDELMDAIRGNVMKNIPSNMSEASRVLNVMAYLTRNEDPNYRIQLGVDYTVSADGKTIDLKLRNAYAKYVKWQRSLGMEVLFDTESAFITGMTNYSGTVKRSCPDNDVLFDSMKAVVMRLSTAVLEKEEVDSFNKQ